MKYIRMSGEGSDAYAFMDHSPSEMQGKRICIIIECLISYVPASRIHSLKEWDGHPPRAPLPPRKMPDQIYGARSSAEAGIFFRSKERMRWEEWLEKLL